MHTLLSAGFALIALTALTMHFGVVSEPLDPAELKEANNHLDGALDVITQQIKTIWDTWDISTYPNFLQSAGISHTSWEVMKLKYEHKVLSQMLNIGGPSDHTFVIAFMGSSVTAGHDSPVNNSFVHLTGQYMAPSFHKLGIHLESRQAAMGNNPCEPYDLCPQTFSGEDADIVHWEQSYNCFGHEEKKKAMFEQFVRQCTRMPRKPIVVFSDSATPNWHEKDCPKRTRRHLRSHEDADEVAAGDVHASIAAATNYLEYARPDFAKGWDRTPAAPTHGRKRLLAGTAHVLTAEEKALLEHAEKDEYLKIVADINAATIPREWGPQVPMFHAYHTQTGIQVWNHRHYETYKCQGPYIPEWGCCSASWHPSIKGHELRAAHHSFFWLIILKTAIEEIKHKMSKGESLPQQFKVISLHIHKEVKHLPQEPLNVSPYFSDNMQCLTTFQPRAWDKGDLRKYIISSNDGKPAWKENVFEELTDPKIIVKAKATGYTDFKSMLHGNIENTALSLKLQFGSEQYKGTFLVCEPPGNWGKLPNGFVTFWEGETEVYITLNVPNKVIEEDSFKFEPTGATKLPYTNREPKDTQHVCVDFAPFKMPKGQHVLTIVPKASSRVMISTIVLPDSH